MSSKRTILCYGDSNTWGVIGDWKDTGLPSSRYEPTCRWPNVMGDMLGEDYLVLNEGLGGRTTIYAPSVKPWRNGEPYLLPCLYTHRPVDLVVIMLGTNDLQLDNPPPENMLGKGIDKLVRMIQEASDCGPGFTPPQVLILAPAEIRRAAESGRVELFARFHADEGVARSRLFPTVYQTVAMERSCFFLNAAQYAEPCEADGVHFTPESHIRLGKAVAKYIRSYIFPER